ncbi:LPXTG cell wall anchor domain-containing protein [Rathayibacter agropyri]|uniref:LPXTG cell wall anchor domain-containing protein n=1 Tax=Rathayibacter agropyri TaxID=1634927 RepID=UPI001FE53FF8|nr:LPXTG cell wall anchor domain-containing protein [Rathayibacter agropyri]
MTARSHPFVTAALAAATLGLVLATAAPASAAPTSETTSGEEALGYNGGGITVDAGPAYAGYDVFVQSQLPSSLSGKGGKLTLEKASLDAEGSARIVNFAGPVSLYFFSPSAVVPDFELPPQPEATAAIYRGEEVTYDVDPIAGTAVIQGAVPTVVAPAESSYQPYIIPFTTATVAPSSYALGQPFDLTFSNISWAGDNDLDGLSTSVVIYSDRTTLGTPTIANAAVTQTIGAEWTTDPHRVALMDSYGRILTSATLDGGAAAKSTPTDTPTETPVATVSATDTGSKPTPALPHLAETGVETGGLALAASALLLAGAGGLLVARRRRASV